MQCRGCDAIPSIGDIGCLRCICGTIGGRDPDSLVLISSHEIKYDGDTVRALNNLSSLMDGNRPAVTDMFRCRRCMIARQRIADEIWTDLSMENLQGIVSSLDDAEIDCPRAEECKDMSVRSIQRMMSGLRSLSEDCRLISGRMGA